MIAMQFRDVGTMQNLGVLGLCVALLAMFWLFSDRQ